jgi:hypothetical protein
MTPQEFARLKRLGNRAAEIRLDSEFKEIIAWLKEGIIRDWAATVPGDRKRRELLYHELIAIGRIENHLDKLGEQARVEQGKIDVAHARQERRDGRQPAGDGF